MAGREYWGDLKYVGVVLLPPAYLAFVLQCSGHTRWPRWAGPALALEPLAVLLLLAATATHDLVRYYPPGATIATALAAEAGPLFWPHLIYNTALVWAATALLVATLSRMSGLYRRQSAFLVAAILLPILLNLFFSTRTSRAAKNPSIPPRSGHNPGCVRRNPSGVSASGSAASSSARNGSCRRPPRATAAIMRGRASSGCSEHTA